MLLRSRSVLRSAGALLLCLLFVACDDKHKMAPFHADRAAVREDARKTASDKGANREQYLHFVENEYVAAAQEPQSTFSASVDTAAYTIIRSKILAGERPPADAVRIADMLNYFDYDYPQPQGNAPVAATLEWAPCPWNTKHQLVRIALAAKRQSIHQQAPRNLVFLVDTSGSMNAPNRLPLVKQALHLLVETLREHDYVSIVTYAGDASVQLPATSGAHPDRIHAAINRLGAGGSTNGSGGIKAAYDQARSHFMKDGVNRVILATDGDFNVGTTSDSELVRLIEEKRNTGVYLTVLGFGMGNLQDGKLEQLARHGNGHYAYIDTLAEAKRLFVDQGGALEIVAKDVKLQVEFNHKHVQAYRLIGYENRVLQNTDFRNDAKDAGDMGSGHTVTALYEIVPHGVTIKLSETVRREFQTAPNDTDAARTDNVLIFRMRYKDPATEQAKEIGFPMTKAEYRRTGTRDMQFASAVAAFGLLLRDSPYKANANWADVQTWASAATAQRPDRQEFVDLVQQAARLVK